MHNLRNIEIDITKLGKLIGANQHQLPTYGKSRDFSYSHVEVDQQYHLVTVERGAELNRKSTSNYSELLYFIFSDATHDIAFSYELNNSVKGQDCRKVTFPKQVELMFSLGGEFDERMECEIKKLLVSSPYNDKFTKVADGLE